MANAKLCGYSALAVFVANKGLATLLGEVPIWSNMDISDDSVLCTDMRKHVNISGQRIHVPGTTHLYKCWVEVKMDKVGDAWIFKTMDVHLHNPNIDKFVHGNRDLDISVPPALDLPMFSSDPVQVADPNLAYSHLMPAYSSHFECETA